MLTRKAESDSRKNIEEQRQVTKRIRLKDKLQLTMTAREQKLAINHVKGQTTLCQGSKG
jgi:hypothetical protein